MAFPDRIERTVQVAFPPEKVWAALTTAEGLAAWFGNEATIDLPPGGAARVRWTGDGFTAEMRVERVVQPAVFGFTWGISGLPADDPRRTYVEFALEPAGAGTRLGSFGFFIAMWVAMMAAMMLPGAAPAVLRRAQASGGVRAVPLFIGSYLAVWALAGAAVYYLYRPHGPVAAGAVTIAAGAYEVTPFKRHFRRRCRDSIRSGFGFGLCCAGSSIGLMAMLVALDVMSLFWMSAVAVLASAQKLLPAKGAIDVPLALALIGLGFVIVIAPWLVPGLTPPTM